MNRTAILEDITDTLLGLLALLRFRLSGERVISLEELMAELDDQATRIPS